MKNNSVKSNKLNQEHKAKDSKGEASRPRILRLKAWSRENKRFIVTLVTSVAIGIMMLVQTVYLTSRIGLLTNQLTYLVDTNSIMEEELATLQNNIEQTLEETNSILSSCKIDIIDIDFSKGLYAAGIKLSLKEFEDDTEVSIYFGTELFQLERDENYFVGTAMLPVTENYDGNVTVVITNGATRYTEIIKDYTGLMHLLENVLFGHLEIFPSYEANKLSVPGAVTAEINSNSYFEFEKLQLYITADDTVIYQKDLDKQTSVDENGNLGDTEEKDESVEVPTTEKEEAVLTDGGSFTFAVGDIEEVPADAQIRMYFELTTVEGYVFQYEFFSAKTYDEKTSVEKAESYEGFVKEEDYFPALYNVLDVKKNAYRLK